MGTAFFRQKMEVIAKCRLGFCQSCITQLLSSINQLSEFILSATFDRRFHITLSSFIDDSRSSLSAGELTIGCRSRSLVI